jgi:hypothetical protein
MGKPFRVDLLHRALALLILRTLRSGDAMHGWANPSGIGERALGEPRFVVSGSTPAWPSQPLPSSADGP